MFHNWVKNFHGNVGFHFASSAGTKQVWILGSSNLWIMIHLNTNTVSFEWTYFVDITLLWFEFCDDCVDANDSFI